MIRSANDRINDLFQKVCGSSQSENPTGINSMNYRPSNRLECIAPVTFPLTLLAEGYLGHIMPIPHLCCPV